MMLRRGLGRKYQVLDLWAKRPRRAVFIDVVAIATDAKDNVYVLNRGPESVQVFNRDGDFLRSFGKGQFVRVHSMFIDKKGDLFVADDEGHTITKWSPSGDLLLTLGQKGKPSDTGYDGRDFRTIERGGPPFNRPTDVSVASNGDIYVTDGYGNARVHCFAPDGKHKLSWGEPGSGKCQFNIPHGLVIDKQDRVLVSDRENNRIQVFTLKGELMAIWDGLYRPNSIRLSPEGVLCVAELTNRVSFWSLDGKLLDRWGDEGMSVDAGGLVSPHGIAMDSHGDVYVGEVCETNAGIDRGFRALQKFIRI
ncbi:MAG: peptidyl-alpha-hydroxyglycine alpha-amidating lyase family protein [Chloroflexota bacterium]